MFRKKTSTNFQNEQRLIIECPMTYTFTLLGTRWRPIIMWKINEGAETFSALQREIPLISKKMLYEDLAALVRRALVDKGPAESHSGNYRLTPLGESLLPVLEAAWAWGQDHAEQGERIAAMDAGKAG